MLTLGERWTDHYLAGVVLLHLLLGQDPPGTPKNPPTPAVLLELLRDVAAGKYDAAKYFVKGGPRQAGIAAEPPALDPKRTYEVIALNAVTPRNTMVSVTAGGVAFEEPIWAILAAHEISRHHRGAPVAVPKAPDTAALWKNIAAAAQSIRDGQYRPESFLGAIDGFIPPAEQAVFELVPVTGAKLDALRARGVQTIPVGNRPKYFELYQP